MGNLRNKVQLIGNVGQDPVITDFENGKRMARVNLATNEHYRNGKGEQVTNTEWHNVVVRNKAAEICEKYLKKGDKVYIEGRLKTRKWQDDSGSERYSTEIHCTEFTFLTPKNESSAEPSTGNQQMSQNRPAQQQQPATQSPGSRNKPYNQTEEEDDLPF